ncbi:hypothetical protein KDN24_20745 [Bacillus sp. Bva_UNVM-123]|uniref:hypothetical protein n=1 Tax=Bacillus sp. Bva_UNVM-123 TaxID=2829798 RepID=UPI00391F1FE0
MGYIAPVTNYQYQQYTERVISKRYDPYRFVPISTIKPPVNPREYIRDEQKSFLSKPHQNNNFRNQQRNHFVENIYSEITGIGRFYNESV